MDNPSLKLLTYGRSPRPWDVNNSSLNSKSPFADGLAVTQEPTAKSIAFSSDGLNAYVVGETNDRIYQYRLGEPYVLSGGAYTGKSFYVGDREATPSGLEFSSDGTKMYIIGRSSTLLHQYALSTAWDISTASWTQTEFAPLNVSNQETVAKCLSFNTDGTMAYVIGETNDTIYQYSLGIAYKIGTGVYTGKSFYVGDREATPSGLDFSTDGTKMYIIGRSSLIPHQYTLSTAWDISTASWTQTEFAPLNIGAQETVAKCLSFNTDGTMAYVIGETNDTIYQYSLSIAYKIGTGVYTGKSFYVGDREATPSGLDFSTDGTKMYIIGRSSTLLHQYTLSTAWDISTASWTQTEFAPLNIGAQETVAKCLSFNTDGTIAYVVGETNATIYQYSLGIAYKIGTGVYTGKSFNVRDREATPSGLEFSSDGTKMYIIGRSSLIPHQYTLSTAWDISTASWTKSEFGRLYVGNQETVAKAVAFSSDGMTAYVVGETNATVYQYSLSVAFNLYSGVYAAKSFYVGDRETTPSGLEFSSDGTKMYIIGRSSLSLHQYTLSTAWDITTSIWSRAEFGRLYVGNQETVAKAVAFSSDGMTAYVVGETNATIYQYSLSVSFNIASALAYGEKSLYIGSRESTPSAIEISPDGTKVFVTGRTSGTIHQFNLSIPNDISTGTWTQTGLHVTNISNIVSGSRSIAFSSDGTSMYLTSSTNKTVYQFSLTSPFVISSATYTNKTYYSGAVAQAHSIQFNDAGTKMYLLTNSPGAIYQYSLSSAWDITTSSYDSVSLTLSAQDTSPTGFCISPDGAKIFVTGDTNDRIYQYTMSTPWSLSSASYDNKSFLVSGQDTSIQSLQFNSAGTRMYVVGNTNDRFYQYHLSTAWDVSTATYNSQYTYSSFYSGVDVYGFYLSSSGKKIIFITSNGLLREGVMGTALTVTTLGLMPPNPSAFYFSSDGTRFFLADFTGTSGYGSITAYSLETAWDVSTIAGTGTIFSISNTTKGQNPNGISFSSDGTKMYLIGTYNDSTYGQNRIYQFTLSTPWSLSSASWSTSSLTLTGINGTYGNISTSPSGLRFDSTGKKAWIVFNNTDRVYEFRLGTAWSIDTASGTNMLGNPTGMTFSTDGTKFYHLDFYGWGGFGSVTAYSLTIAWDISTIGGTGQTFSVSNYANGNYPTAMTFSSDGTKLYLIGSRNDPSSGQNKVFQYALSTAWNITTASISTTSATLNQLNSTYDNLSLSSSGLRFDSTGKRMYIVYNNVDLVYEFRLGTAWNVNTAYSTAMLSNPTGLAFSSDGTKFYHLDFYGWGGFGSVTAYSLTTAWDISTIGGTGQTFSVSNYANGNYPTAMTFSSDGTKMYLIGSRNDGPSGQNKVFQYTLSTAWNITTASYTTVSPTLSQLNNTYESMSLSPSGIRFDSTGKRMYIIYNNRDQIWEFRLGTAWNVSTAYSTAMLSNPTGLAFSSDGTKFYQLDFYSWGGLGGLTAYSLTTAWDISTIGGTGQTYNTVNYAHGNYPTAMTFSADGTKLYLIGSRNDGTSGQNKIFQYTLSTAWNITTASYTTVSPTLSQLNNTYENMSLSPSGIRFDSTGKRMYIIYNNRGQIWEFRLGTAWNVSTAYSTAMLGNPTGMAFSTDGTKFYQLDFYSWGGLGGVTAYSLSSAWDISTIGGTGQTYNTVNYAHGNYPTAMTFSADGTKMYLIGSRNDGPSGQNKVFQYTLSTAWNVATASYASKQFSIASLNSTYENMSTSPSGLRLNSDGTQIYYIANNVDTVYSSRMSTAYDISTASLPLSEATLNNIYIGDGGSKVYIVGTTNDRVYQFSLTTAYEGRTLKYSGKSFSVTTQETDPHGISFSSDGTKLYVIGTANKTVYQYTLSTAWNVSTASYSNKSFSTNAQESSPYGITFSTDGTAMFLVGASNYVHKYALSTAWDISTARFNILLNGYVGYQEASGTEFFFKPDGTRVYVVGTTSDTIYQYSLSTAWDLSTMAYDAKSLSISARDGETRGLVFKDDGTVMYLVGTTNDTVYQYTLSTAWDITTGTYASKSLSVTAQDANPQSIQFGDSGAKMYMIGSTNNTVYQYGLTTAWDIATASYSSISFNTLVSGMTGLVTGLWFSNDGTKMFVCFYDRKLIARYDLGTAWNVSTATFTNITCYVGDQETLPHSVNFNSDGTIMTVLGVTADQIFRYNLSTAWDLRTASLVNLGNVTATDRFSVSSQGTNPWSIYFDSLGTKMFVLITSSNRIYRYDLSVAWNISTAVYSGNNYSVNFVETSPRSVVLNDDGTKMFVAGRTLQSLIEFIM